MQCAPSKWVNLALIARGSHLYGAHPYSTEFRHTNRVFPAQPPSGILRPHGTYPHSNTFPGTLW